LVLVALPILSKYEGEHLIQNFIHSFHFTSPDV